MSDHPSITGTFCHKYRKQCTRSWKPCHLPHSQTQLVYLSHIMCLGPVIGCSTLSRQITKPPPWSAATCSMINPMFNLGVSARTNRELWRYASHQLSRPAVQRIDSLILDWTRNRALARPAVPLKKKKKPSRSRGTVPHHSLHLWLPPPLSPAHVWFANCLLFQKVSFAPPTKVATANRGLFLVRHLGLFRGGPNLSPEFTAGNVEGSWEKWSSYRGSTVL